MGNVSVVYLYKKSNESKSDTHACSSIKAEMSFFVAIGNIAFMLFALSLPPGSRQLMCYLGSGASSFL